MADEAALDLFTEQGFGPAFGAVLTSAIETMIEAGYPPEAVLMELYMSGELAYTAQHFVDTGIIDQMDFHSRTSQYGSMTRGWRFADIDLEEPHARRRSRRSAPASFAAEWQAEQRDRRAALRTAARAAPASSAQRMGSGDAAGVPHAGKKA